MKTTRLAFIGAGNMAGSLIGGLVAGGWDPDNIAVSDPDSERLSTLGSRFRINTDTNNHSVVENARVVILAVKPQVIHEVALDLASLVQKNQPLLISIAAGVRATDLQRWLGGSCALVRCMPNTPALIGCGATALYANDAVTEAQKQLADEILRAAGITTWVQQEELLDVVTALSGSGPAYFFLLMEAMQNSAVELGLDQETANLLTLQTALGAARMAGESGVAAEELRARVTSKGGTTAAAVASFEQNGFHYNVSKALRAAYERSRELADELGRNT